MKGVIYYATSLRDNRKYVGKTTDFNVRRLKHLWDARHSSATYFHRALALYEFRWEIIEECDESKLNEREKYWIKSYETNRSDHGFNLTEGGDGGRLNDACCKQISEKLKGKPKSDVAKARMSEARRGSLQSEETKRKISETLSGRKLSNEHRAKVSAAMKQRAMKIRLLIEQHGLAGVL